MPGSVGIEIELALDTPGQFTNVSTNLAQAFSTPEAMSAALNLTVLSVPVVEQKAERQDREEAVELGAERQQLCRRSRA